MNDLLRVDLTALTSLGIGRQGITAEELSELAGPAKAAVRHTLAMRKSQRIGFFDLPDDQDAARAALQFAQTLPAQIETMVVLGIGGSSLGPHALYSALSPPLPWLRARSPGMPRRLLFPDNSDPDTFRAVLELCHPERTVWNVVTKSGATAETAAQLLALYHHLENKLGSEQARAKIVVTTDPSKSALLDVARTIGLTTFPLPSSVGGRFSVLSSVGLVPAAVAGFDVMGLLDGARWMRQQALSESLQDNPALMLATLLHAHHQRRGRAITVMMPYADALFDCADWFRQLWAESLGKALDVDGKTVNVGPTPIASRGATDQHSQLQLYAEGPDDKVFLFVAPKTRAHLPLNDSPVARHPDYAYLVGRDMGELIDAELRGTMSSLAGRGRPCASIELARVDAPSVGAFLMLWMAATAFAGPLYRVNPFDQPGVEEAKRLAYAALGRSGFASEGAKLAALSSDPRYCFPRERT